jgi:hypothetical protein
MTVLTEGIHPGEFLMSEAVGNRSREAITILSGEGVLSPGTVVGLVDGDTGTVTVTKVDVGGGKGAITLADPAYGAGVKEGAYKVVIIEPATDAGKFAVEDPDGIIIGTGTVAVAFDGVVKFTLADAATDFVAGDTATINVAIADAASSGKWRSADPTNTDGSGVGAAVILYGVDATSADQKVTAIVRDAVVNGHCLVYDAAVDDAPKTATKVAELKAAGIIVRN